MAGPAIEVARRDSPAEASGSADVTTRDQRAALRRMSSSVPMFCAHAVAAEAAEAEMEGARALAASQQLAAQAAEARRKAEQSYAEEMKRWKTKRRKWRPPGLMINR